MDDKFDELISAIGSIGEEISANAIDAQVLSNIDYSLSKIAEALENISSIMMEKNKQ